MQASAANVSLVYCSATEMSRPFPEKLEAASEAGFDGISIMIPEYIAMKRDGVTDADLAAMIEDAGLFVNEISTATAWLSGKPTKQEELGFPLVNLLGGEGINCTAITGPFLGLDEAVGAFAAICDRAAAFGVRCHIEFSPAFHDPHDLRTAWEIVKRADRPNGGILFDTWHFFRSGGSLADLREVDPSKIFAIQLADAPASPQHSDLAEDTYHRLLPGEGDLDLVGCLKALDDIGVDLPLGGEVISPKWKDRPVLDNAKQLHSSMTALVRAAKDRVR